MTIPVLGTGLLEYKAQYPGPAYPHGEKRQSGLPRSSGGAFSLLSSFGPDHHLCPEPLDPQLLKSSRSRFLSQCRLSESTVGPMLASGNGPVFQSSPFDSAGGKNRKRKKSVGGHQAPPSPAGKDLLA